MTNKKNLPWLFSASLLFAPLATAANLTWDDGDTNGLWDTSSNNWGGPTWNNTTPDNAIFGATGAGTVTLNEAISVGNITFDTVGYDIAGTPDLTLSAPTTITTNADATISTQMIESGALTKAGTGTLTLDSINTYTGGTTVNGGTLALHSTSGGNCVIRGTLTVNSAGTVLMGGDDWTGLGFGADARVTTLNVAGGTVNNTKNTSWVKGAAVNLTGGSMTGGEYHWINSSLQSLASDTTATLGSYLHIRKDYGSPDLTIDVADGTAATDLLISGQIKQTGGAAAVTKTGAGTLTLDSINIYTGGTTVNEGTLNLGYNGGTWNVCAIRGTLTVNSAGTVVVGGKDWGGFGASGQAAAVRTLNVAGGTVTNNLVNGFIADATVNLSGGLMTGGNYMWVSSTLNSKAHTTTATFASDLRVRKDWGSTDLTIDVEDGAAATDLDITGTISQGGVAAVTKTGAGVLQFSGSNSYTGPTNVNQGTLSVTGSLAAASSVTVAPGATLTGTGIVGGSVSAAGTVAPGASAGTLTTGPAILTGTLAIEIDGASGDKLLSTGAIDITGAALTVTELGGGYTQPSYVIAEGTSISGPFASVPAGYAVTIVPGGAGQRAVLTAGRGFAAWVSANAPGQTMTMDHDEDGVQNGIEYFMGETGSGFTAMPAPDASRTVSWTKDAAYTGAYSSDYLVETSTNLVDWNPVPVGEVSIGTTIDYPIPNGDPARFVRLKVIGNHSAVLDRPSDPEPSWDTSRLLDLDDDPEYNYTATPKLNWDFFGGRPRIINKYEWGAYDHRNILGIDYTFFNAHSENFSSPASGSFLQAIMDPPKVGVLQFAKLGKVIYVEGGGERPRAYDPATVQAWVSNYPNMILAGGEASEVDVITQTWSSRYYGRKPTGTGGRSYPSIWFDYLESALKRSPAPWMRMEFNDTWMAAAYTAGEYALISGGPQLFYRDTYSNVAKMTACRSAFRTNPHPVTVQWAGEVWLTCTNADDVRNSGAEPVYTAGTGGYGSSFSLMRQMLYYSWMQGARSFNFEDAKAFSTDIAADYIAPLGAFAKKADDFFAATGPPGPVDTPVAVLSEFSNAWRVPDVSHWKWLTYKTAESAYALGDYHLHGLHNFFIPHYAQAPLIYKTPQETYTEEYALPPTPYGDCADYLLSNVREEALWRYNLLIWGGVPPEAPTVVRDKLFNHTVRGGRAIVFGAAAKSMFPELFNGSTSVVPAGSTINYDGESFAESDAFTRYHLADTAGMTVLASVGGSPLIVEADRLVIVLSEYGMNKDHHYHPSDARWSSFTLISDPYTLLNHAKKLLDHEVSACTPISVGGANLHYVVTRPRPGEYLVGLFNNKLTSEPFSITCKYGTVISLTEVPFNDNQDQLKTVANGAAYVASAYRQDPNLPFDFGTSDASHIEGCDVRLFRVLVDETTSPRPYPDISFPGRPEGRVLAVTGLGYIRHYIQNMPSFFQWFDGVKVGADSLLAMDEGWITENAFWLDRRGVRVVVDARGLAESDTLAVINKLARIDSGRKNLIVDTPSATVQSAAAGAGASLMETADINRVYLKGQRFDPAASLNILDRYYGDEEDLYRDLRHCRDGAVVDELRGALHAPIKVDQAVGNDFLYVGPYLDNLRERLQQDPTGFRKFRGVKIDSTYLLSKTAEALLEDKAALDQLGLKLVVDLRRDVMHFDRITWYPGLPNYARGTDLYAEIIDKMQLMGSTELIVYLTQALGGSAAFGQYEATVRQFAQQAAAHGINLHLDKHGDISTTVTDEPNVYTMGNWGPPSKLKLVRSNGSIGVGSTTIYDEEIGLYAPAAPTP